MPCLILSVILVKVLAVYSLKEFSLARYSSTLMYANNSVIDINLVGEGFVIGHTTEEGALECHTDDTTCCRRIDDPNGNGKGEWYYPNGTVVPPPNNGNSIYRTRGDMVIRLNRRPGILPPNGTYKCVIPGAGGVNITRYITLGASKNHLCDDLRSITTGSDILYVPPRDISSGLPAGKHYVGTIATYNCPSGYQPVGGSVKACVEGGVWNGTDRTCVTIPCSTSEITPPTNGRVSISGLTANYTCNSGYVLNGPQIRTCGNDGSWTLTPPTCESTATPTHATTKPPISSSPPTTEPTSNPSSSVPSNTDPGTTSTEGDVTSTATRFTAPTGIDIQISTPTTINTESVAIGVTAVVCIIILLVIIALLLVYIMSLKKQLKLSQFNISGVNPVETVQYETVTESTKSKEGRSCDTEYEGVGGMYEEVDKLREPHPPKGDYELSQCAAYGSVTH